MIAALASTAGHAADELAARFLPHPDNPEGNA